MPFGKYEDMDLTEVPHYYLRWLREQKWVGPWLVQGVDEVLNGRPAAQSEPTANGIVKQGASDSPKAKGFSVRQSSKVIQAITDQEGNIVAWSTNEQMAQLLCKLLNEHQELKKRKVRPNEDNRSN
jgi:hypothetical protein